MSVFDNNRNTDYLFMVCFKRRGIIGSLGQRPKDCPPINIER